MFKKLTLCSLICVSTVQSSYSSDLKNNLIIIGATAVTATAGYFIGKGTGILIKKAAQSRFKEEISIVASQFLIKEDQRNEIKEIALRNHELYYSSGELRNFPLLKYKNDLDWYISSLYFCRLFNWFNAEIIDTIAQLSAIRELIITDYAFIKERREFEKNLKPA